MMPFPTSWTDTRGTDPRGLVEPMAGDGLPRILRSVVRESGLSYLHRREDLLAGVVERRIRSLGLGSAEDYANLLAGPFTAPNELATLVDMVTVGETAFFRHREQMAVLADRILPDILTGRRPGTIVNAWSAGCSTGEEAYTLAFLFDEAGWLPATRVLGTDIAPSALTVARAGVYGPRALRETSVHRIGLHLERQGARVRVPGPVRRRVRFEHHNLIKAGRPAGFPIGGMDLILFRNVLIYFDKATGRAAVRRLLDGLAPGGWLVTGPSDPVFPVSAPFEALTTPGGIVYRRTRDGEIARDDESAWASPKTAPKADPDPMAGPKAPAEPRRASPERAPAPAPAPAPTPAPAASLADALDHIRRVADGGDLPLAQKAAQRLAEQYPESLEGQFLNGLLLLGLGRGDDAVSALRRAVYLDSDAPVPHLVMGVALARAGQVTAARRALARATHLLAAYPDDTVVPLSDGEPAPQVMAAARANLARLNPKAEYAP